MRAFAAIIALPLLLAACGDDAAEENSLPEPSGGNSRILEGTIDDSMIDLSGAETVIVADENGAVEGNDQHPPEEAKAAQSEPSEPAESEEAAESDGE